MSAVSSLVILVDQARSRWTHSRLCWQCCTSCKRNRPCWCSKEQVGLGISLTYPQYQEFANFLSAHQLTEFQTDFTDATFSLIYVDKGQKEDVIADLIDFYHGKVEISDQGLKEVEVPIQL